MSVTIIAGGFWGDEGKGKISAYLAMADNPAIVARAGVGPNAGHTVYHKGQKIVMRQLPGGFVNPSSRLLIGAGVLVNPEVLLSEIETLDVADRVGVDPHCAIIEQEHIDLDRGSKHLSKTVGTTGTGCGPANEARARRKIKLAEQIEALQPYLADVAAEVNAAVRLGQNVLIEGSQGFGLSLFHGDYPYVTSKDVTASSFAADVGLGPTRVDDVVVVYKAYASRVGAGPFPTEMPREKVQALGWEEFGAVTGRPRRIGEFDYDVARRSAMINGATQIAITNLDRRFKDAFAASRLEELPADARAFIDGIQEAIGVPVTLISTGPDLEHMIDLR